MTENWQISLISRLERSLGRQLTAGDLGCVAWNADAKSLTVETPPLLAELRSNNVVSNVFRSRADGRLPFSSDNGAA